MSKMDTTFAMTCADIIENGIWDTDREVRPRWNDGTPAHTVKKFGVINRYDLSKEFPILTLRRTPIKSAFDEVLWIWQKKSNNIHDLKSHVWDQWADETGSIGKAYGYQMGKKYPVKGIDIEKAKALFGEDGIYEVEVSKGGFQYALTGKYSGNYSPRISPFDINKFNACHLFVRTGKRGVPLEMWMDQVDHALYDLKYNPASRRIIVTSWNPADATEMHLEPCAYSMTFNVSGSKLNAILNQRSQDMLAAGAWNVAQYSLLLMLFAKVSGYEPGELVHVIADCHIYDRHLPIVKELITREPYNAPKVYLNPDLKDFYKATTKDIIIEGEYKYHEFNDKFEVAV